MSITIVLDFVETHLDEMFDEVYRLRNFPYETLGASNQRLLAAADRYIEFARIQEPTLTDRITCNDDLSDIWLTRRVVS